MTSFKTFISKFRIYVLVYCIGLYLSGLLIKINGKKKTLISQVGFSHYIFFPTNGE